jgi:hypothetical protein
LGHVKVLKKIQEAQSISVQTSQCWSVNEKVEDVFEYCSFQLVQFAFENQAEKYKTPKRQDNERIASLQRRVRVHFTFVISYRQIV